MLMTGAEIKFILDELGKPMYDLTEWEAGFLRSVRSHFALYGSLSAKQMQTLSRIWDKF